MWARQILPRGVRSTLRVRSHLLCGCSGRSLGVTGEGVCMDRMGRTFQARVLYDRYISRTSHTAHWSRTESTGRARDAKSEQSFMNHVCNTPQTAQIGTMTHVTRQRTRHWPLRRVTDRDTVPSAVSLTASPTPRGAATRDTLSHPGAHAVPLSMSMSMDMYCT